MNPNLPTNIPIIPQGTSNRFENMMVQSNSSNISQPGMMMKVVRSAYKTVEPGDSLDMDASHMDVQITPIADSSDSELGDSHLRALEKIAMQRGADQFTGTPSAIYRETSDAKWDPDTVRQTKKEMEVRYILSLFRMFCQCHCQIYLDYDRIICLKQRALAREIVNATSPSQTHSSFQYRTSMLRNTNVVIENGTDDTRRMNSLRVAVDSPDIDAKTALRNVYSTPRADSENEESLDDGDNALEALNHRKNDRLNVGTDSESDESPSHSAQLELRLSQRFSSEELKHQKEEMLNQMQSLLEKEKLRSTSPHATSPLAVVNQ